MALPSAFRQPSALLSSAALEGDLPIPNTVTTYVNPKPYYETM